MPFFPPTPSRAGSRLDRYRRVLEQSFSRLDALLNELMGRGKRPTNHQG